MVDIEMQRLLHSGVLKQEISQYYSTVMMPE